MKDLETLFEGYVKGGSPITYLDSSRLQHQYMTRIEILKTVLKSVLGYRKSKAVNIISLYLNFLNLVHDCKSLDTVVTNGGGDVSHNSWSQPLFGSPRHRTAVCWLMSHKYAVNTPFSVGKNLTYPPINTTASSLSLAGSKKHTLGGMPIR